MKQLDIFSPQRERFSVETTPEIERALRANMPVAIGVSGGKDSSAAAYATINYLNKIGHTGPRLLIHSDLGRTEWKDSLPTCQRLAERLNVELVVVRRKAGDMMDRWLTRWANNVARYENLECVKLILPWSTPSMRFCTSEMKNAIISRELVRRFPNCVILSVTGIRRQESSKRAKMPVAKADKRLANKRAKTSGYVWNSIIEWDLKEEVWPIHREQNLPVHEAYGVYGASRVSCCFCIMSADGDILAALGDSRNHDLYREMVDLEITSGFSFQDDYWLGDARPDLLAPGMIQLLEAAKQLARQRTTIEAQIPESLLYTEGWPTRIPTYSEATLIGTIRQQVGKLHELDVAYTEPTAIIERYEELYAEARRREQEAEAKKLKALPESIS